MPRFNIVPKRTRIIVKEGTETSGHHGHRGRPGRVGGSLPGTGAAPRELTPLERLRREQYNSRRRWRGTNRRLRELYHNGEITWQEYEQRFIALREREMQRMRDAQQVYEMETANEAAYNPAREEFEEQMREMDVPAGQGMRVHDREGNVAPQAVQDQYQEDLAEAREREEAEARIAAEEAAAEEQSKGALAQGRQANAVEFMQDWQSIPADTSNSVDVRVRDNYDNYVRSQDYTHLGYDEARIAMEADLDRAMKEKFGFSKDDLGKMFYTEGAHADVSVGMNSDYMRLRADIYDDDTGRLVGNVKFGFETLGAAKTKFNADFLEISMKRYMNKGIGSKIATRATMLAKMAGYEKMTFSADITIGKYAWAKEGANFARGDALEWANEKFQSWLSRAAVQLPWNDERRSILLGLQLPRFNSAYDIATYDPGIVVWGREIRNKGVKKGMKLHLGKAFMLDDFGLGSWSAEVNLAEIGNF